MEAKNCFYSTKKVFIRWKKALHIIQPFGMFYSVVEAVNYIESIGQPKSEYLFECLDGIFDGSNL